MLKSIKIPKAIDAGICKICSSLNFGILCSKKHLIIWRKGCRYIDIDSREIQRKEKNPSKIIMDYKRKNEL